MTDYCIYGNELSLFSRKLESAMIFYGLDFEFKAQNPEMNQRAGTHQIPVLKTPENWVLADTTPIMQMLDARVPERALFPSGLQGLLVRVVEEYLDEWLGRTMVHYRWHYPESAEFAAIKLANGNEDLADTIAQWGARACRATGTESKVQQQAAEHEYKRLLEAAEVQLEQSSYLLGNRPCAVDAIFLGGLRAHTYCDPAPKRLVEKFPRVVSWLESEADFWDGDGELLAFENPGVFAEQVLRDMPSTYKAFILGNKAACEAEKKSFVCHIYEEDVSFLKRSYPEQSRQMLSAYIEKALDDTDKQKALAWLQEKNLAEVFV